MREILFRGKVARDCVGVSTQRKYKKGTWVFGDLSHTNYDPPLIDQNNDDPVPVDPSTVGQYTGLTDKNGKKIFEGDIFKFPDEVWESYYTSCGTEYDSWEVENYGVVGFCDYSGRFDFIKYKFSENSVEADLHENRDMEFYEFVSELEVIGNIHDNPELLKAEGEQ